MNTPQRHIVICGISIVALALETVLNEQDKQTVTRLDPRLPGVVERIAALNPDVVMIEQWNGHADLTLALLNLNIPLIELDVEHKHATLLTGRRFPAVGVADLTQVIEQVAAEAQTRFPTEHSK